MNEPNIELEFRRRAWKKVLLGSCGFILLCALLAGISALGYMPRGPFGLIPPAIPFVYFCVGFIELVSGRPYQLLADAWMSLKGWQRGVIGVLIVVVWFAIVIMGVTAAIMAIH
jgi:hypothetical protein